MIPLIFAIFADMDSAAVAALTVAADCPAAVSVWRRDL